MFLLTPSVTGSEASVYTVVGFLVVLTLRIILSGAYF